MVRKSKTVSSGVVWIMVLNGNLAGIKFRVFLIPENTLLYRICGQLLCFLEGVKSPSSHLSMEPPTHASFALLWFFPVPHHKSSVSIWFMWKVWPLHACVCTVVFKTTVNNYLLKGRKYGARLWFEVSWLRVHWVSPPCMNLYWLTASQNKKKLH